MVVEIIVVCVRLQKKLCNIFNSAKITPSVRQAFCFCDIDSDGDREPFMTERLVEVFTTGESRRDVLTDCVLTDLSGLNVDLEWIIDQCHDGAGNMRDRYKGMASQIKWHCSKAV